MQDTKEHIQLIRNLLKQIDRPIKQVLIEARIVNLIKDNSYDFGVRLGATTTIKNANITTPTNILGHLNLDLSAIPIDATPVSFGVALAKLSDGVLLDLELSALESEGRAKIIAKPRIVTTNQQEATIASGEDIPYQEITESGATAVSFKKALLSLKVTPNITADKKLLMKLHINQDSDSGRRVQGVPIIQTKSIDTNVLVRHGQTIVLGGIYKQDKNRVTTRIPFLGELPLIGSLFRRTQDRIRNEELLIFITPRIITNI